MLKLVIIGIGGFTGAIMRYAVGSFVHRLLDKPFFPYGTLTVNILGCLLIGLLSGLVETRQLFSPEIRLFVFIGFLGSFTTFSTFGYEVFNFARDGELTLSFANILLHLFLGFAAVGAGYALSKIV